MLVDAHCHFDYACFDGKRAQLLQQCESEGVGALVIPGVRVSDWQRVRDVAGADRRVSFCLGIHPWYVDEHTSADLDQLTALLARREDGCVALGECGLDRLHGSLERQLPWFESQVDIAKRLEVPLVIHSVRTHDEVGAVLRRKQVSSPVLVHGFSGSPEQARSLAGLGCYIGVGGVITYSRASKTRRAVADLPLNRLVLETDAPDMPPQGITKGANSPLYLPRVLKALCELRSESEHVIRAQLEQNARALYGWS